MSHGQRSRVMKSMKDMNLNNGLTSLGLSVCSVSMLFNTTKYNEIYKYDLDAGFKLPL